MVLWLLILPFAFMPSMGLWTVLLCGVVGYQLLGFEDIGVEIECVGARAWRAGALLRRGPPCAAARPAEQLPQQAAC
jgi:hypothetical protein